MALVSEELENWPYPYSICNERAIDCVRQISEGDAIVLSQLKEGGSLGS